MTQDRLPGMPAIDPLDDYQERLLREHPGLAGELMADGNSTVLEHWFETDCIEIPVAFQHYWREGYLPGERS